MDFTLLTPVRQVIDSISGRLSEAGIEQADNDAAILIAYSFGVSKSDVTLASIMGGSLGDLKSAGHCFVALPAGSEGSLQGKRAFLQDLQERVGRRAAREPLQYIIGKAPFRYLTVAVGPGVFIPRQETETLVQIGLDWVDEQAIDAPVILDLCAGSGVVGLAAVTELQARKAQVYAVEIDDQAIAWTRKNRDQILWSQPESKSRYHLVQADASSPQTLAQLDDQADLVLTNPPYVPLTQIPQQPEVRDYDPAAALYGGSDDGLAIPEKIVRRAAAFLRPGGLLVMEHDSSQSHALVSFATSVGFSQAHTAPDLTGRDRFLVADKAEG